MGRFGWWALTVLTAGSLMVLPLAPSLSEGLRVAVCRATGGGCGDVPALTRCAVLARDSSIASSLTVSRRETSHEGGRLVTTDTMMDGGAVVTLSPAPGLGQRAAQYRFSRHDDADAWLDHYHRLDQPVVSAAVGPSGDGLHAGVRSVVRALGFTDPDDIGRPDSVTVDGLPRLTLDASGRSTTMGALWLADNQFELAASLATQLGLVADATYAVTSDAAGRPTRLVVGGEAGQTGDGRYLAANRLIRLREQGSSLGQGADQAAADRARGVRTAQRVVLDLRSEANLKAFARVFVADGRLTAPRPAPDPQAITDLVARIATDAVLVRATTRTRPASVGSVGRSTTTLVQGFSQDFAVPASRLAALPGCSR